MNKSILIRGSIIMGLFLAIIGTAVGCSLIKADGTEPTISNGDDIYLTVGDFTVTNAELWEVMKSVDGLGYLLDYVDQIILKEYIDVITQEEVDAEIEYLIYQTTSEDFIAKIQADPEINQDYIDAFESNLIVLGFDPSNPDDLRDYVEVGIAKTKIARAYVLSAEEGDQYFLTAEDVEEYYYSVTYGDSCFVDLRFESVIEANLVFEHFDLVPNFNLGIGEYDGILPIEDVASDGFILDENTFQLDDDQVFSKYIEMWNYMNPWEDAIPLDVTQEDYCNNYSDVSVYNFDDMVRDRSSEDPYTILATYLFTTLTLDEEVEDGIRFSHSAQSVGDGFVYAYKVSEEDIIEFDDLSDDDMIDLKSDILDLILTNDVIGDIMSTVNEDLDFEIYDPYLALNYQHAYGVETDNNGSSSVVAVLFGEEILADDIFEYMADRVGAFYSIELIKSEMVLASSHYSDIYGSDYDYMDSNLDEMVDNREDLREMKSYFGSNGFANYGFPSTAYTWSEFIYLAYHVKTEADVIEQLFVVQELQPLVVYPTLDYNNVSDYIQQQSDEYFSLNVSHLLIFVDFDNDYSPDEFDVYLEGLTVEELAEYQVLKSAFDTLIFQKTDSGLTFEEIVDQYEDSLIGDLENEWAEFKEYGFKIMTENLTPQTSLTNINSDGFDQTFVESLKNLYDAYVVEKANSTEDITEYLYTQVTETAFGIHLILGSEGTAFYQNSAKFDDDDSDIVHSVGSENTSSVPNEAQVLLYNEIKFAASGGPFTQELLPTEVYTAIDTYYGTLFDAYFSQTGFSIAAINYMLDNNAQFTDASNVGSLESILEVLYTLNFPDEFVIQD